MLCGQLYDVNNCVTVLYCVDSCMVLITMLEYYTMWAAVITVLYLFAVRTAVWCL